MHWRQYRQQFVLCAKRYVVLVHRQLQLLDQRVEMLAVNAEFAVDRFHFCALVHTVAAKNFAELIDQLFFDARLINILEK